MTYNYGSPEQIDDPGGRSPTPGGCRGCPEATLHLMPVFLRPFLVRLFLSFRKTPVVSEESLHPSITNLISSLLERQSSEVTKKTQSGIVIRAKFMDPLWVGDDFKTNLQVEFGDVEVFTGNMLALGATNRGGVTFAHTILGGVEFLYLHILEMVLCNKSEIDIRLGVLEIKGTASNPSTVIDTLTNEFSALMMKRQDDGDCAPLFDGLTPFGALPAAGYRYFYGFDAELVEAKLRAKLGASDSGDGSTKK